jgi:hypothetical protein
MAFGQGQMSDITEHPFLASAVGRTDRRTSFVPRHGTTMEP